MPKSKSTAINAFMLSYLSADPKIEQLDALRLTKRPEVFTQMIAQIEMAKQLSDMSHVEVSIEKGKSRSRQTRSDEPS